MSQIKKVAVIGSGVMGAAIAAHVANSNTEVLLLDVVPEGANDRNVLANNALAKMLKTDPAPFTHKRKAKLVKTGNLEDNIADLKDVDWVIEAIIEDVDIKRSLFAKIEENKGDSTIVSSNTSTIPLQDLIEGRSDSFKSNFLITHFFNPPRYMRLFELVAGAGADSNVVQRIEEFADIRLGKGVVKCNDTPGFIANRIGCFWLTVAVLEAIDLGISIEEADLVMSRPFGIPKTGVFGLIDLVGLDLMPLIAKSFAKSLSKNDMFNKVYNQPKLVADMIKDGYTGRKGKGGFYRLNTENGARIKEAKDLKTGEYNTANKPKLESVDAAKKSLNALLEHEDIGGQYARRVMLKTLAYAASLVPEIAGDIRSIDEAMRLGYNWKYGIFQIIDKLGNGEVSGADYLASCLEKDGLEIPEILSKAAGKQFYNSSDEARLYLNLSGEYERVETVSGRFMLSDKKFANKPVKKNASSALWDIGDGILCLEYTSKMNSVDPLILEMIQQTVEVVNDGFRGLIIANDGDNFCVGANIGILLFAANVAAWKQIREIIKQGQDAYMGLKYAPFPVVAAPSGMALGGGCELLLHSDAVQAHIETYTGLVEVGVGIIPGWGGCKEMIFRNLQERLDEQATIAKLGRMFSFLSPIKTLNTMPAISKSFENIATAKVAKSAEYARDMNILKKEDGITMNMQRLLPDAKARCIELATDYQVPEKRMISLPGKTARSALNMAVNGFVKSGKATAYDEVVARSLAEVLSGGSTDITKEIDEQYMLDLELDVFMELVKNQGTIDRLEHMLETGKPLRN